MNRWKIGISVIIVVMMSCGADENPTKNNDKPSNSNNKTTNASNNKTSSNNKTNSNNTNSNNKSNSNNKTSSNNKTNTADCIPSKEQWDLIIKTRVDKNCGDCHGASPKFGAPYSLVDYDAMIAGKEGERHVDKIATRTANYTMPPNGTKVSHQDRDTITEWASCGNIHPDHSIGLVANRTVHNAPQTPPAGSTQHEFIADKFAVSKNTLDDYECFAFDAPKDGGFIQRFEAIIDEARVLHHLVLMRADNVPSKQFSGFQCAAQSGQFYYAWAPGGGALQFPDGGVEINPDEKYVLQIHYNNGAGIENAVDSSGVRVYISPKVTNEYRMLDLGTGIPNITVAPGEKVESSDTCTVTKDMTAFIGFPHMHEIGSEFHETITRTGGQKESMIDLSGWSFENQPFYDYNIKLKIGDKIKTTCLYENYKNDAVSGGLGSAEEMCFDFVFVTPTDAGCR